MGVWVGEGGEEGGEVMVSQLRCYLRLICYIISTMCITKQFLSLLLCYFRTALCLPTSILMFSCLLSNLPVLSFFIDRYAEVLPLNL